MLDHVVQFLDQGTMVSESLPPPSPPPLEVDFEPLGFGNFPTGSVNV